MGSRSETLAHARALFVRPRCRMWLAALLCAASGAGYADDLKCPASAARQMTGCYELRLLPPPAAEPLAFRPPERIRLDRKKRTGKDVPEGMPCMRELGGRTLRPIGPLAAGQERFWIGSWACRADGELVLIWSSGFDGVEVHLKPTDPSSPASYEGTASSFKDAYYNDEKDPVCVAEAHRIDCD